MGTGTRHDMATEPSTRITGHDDGHTCPRCQGFLVDDWLLDMAQGGYLWGAGRRCVNCGHIMQVRACASRARAESGPSPARGHSWHEAA